MDNDGKDNDRREGTSLGRSDGSETPLSEQLRLSSMAAAKEIIKAERGFSRWVGGIIAGLIMLGIAVVGSLLWTQNTRLTEACSTLVTLQQRVNELAAQVGQGTQYRYTSQDATADRGSLMKLIDSCGDRITLHDQDLGNIHERLARLEATTNMHVSKAVDKPVPN